MTTVVIRDQARGVFEGKLLEGSLIKDPVVKIEVTDIKEEGPIIQYAIGAKLTVPVSLIEALEEKPVQPKPSPDIRSEAEDKDEKKAKK